METAIEIANPTAGGGRGAATSPGAPAAAAAAPTSENRAAFADAIGQVLAAELDRFLKMRGM